MWRRRNDKRSNWRNIPGTRVFEFELHLKHVGGCRLHALALFLRNSMEAFVKHSILRIKLKQKRAMHCQLICAKKECDFVFVSQICGVCASLARSLRGMLNENKYILAIQMHATNLYYYRLRTLRAICRHPLDTVHVHYAESPESNVIKDFKLAIVVVYFYEYASTFPTSHRIIAQGGLCSHVYRVFRVINASERPLLPWEWLPSVCECHKRKCDQVNNNNSPP